MLKVNIPKHTYTIIKNIGCPNGIIEDRKGYFISVILKSVLLVIPSVIFMYSILHERT